MEEEHQSFPEVFISCIDTLIYWIGLIAYIGYWSGHVLYIQPASYTMFIIFVLACWHLFISTKRKEQLRQMGMSLVRLQIFGHVTSISNFDVII